MKLSGFQKKIEIENTSTSIIINYYIIIELKNAICIDDLRTSVATKTSSQPTPL